MLTIIIDGYLLGIDCGNLPEIENGEVILTGTKFRDTATYFCRAGYKLIGDRLRRCRSNGAWSTVAPSCVGKVDLYNVLEPKLIECFFIPFKLLTVDH